MTNACYDELRRRKRRPITSLEPIDDAGDEIESPRWIADPGELPEDNVVRAELGNAIQHCLDELPTDFKVVVVLVDVQGMDYLEAADTIGKPLGTVKSRLASWTQPDEGMSPRFLGTFTTVNASRNIRKRF